MSRIPLRVEIDVLSVHGVSRARAHLIGAAVHAELARLLGNEAAARQLRGRAESGAITSADALNAGRLAVARQERPERIGQRLAQRVSQHLLTRTGSLASVGARR